MVFVKYFTYLISKKPKSKVCKFITEENWNGICLSVFRNNNTFFSLAFYVICKHIVILANFLKHMSFCNSIRFNKTVTLLETNEVRHIQSCLYNSYTIINFLFYNLTHFHEPNIVILITMWTILFDYFS